MDASAPENEDVPTRNEPFCLPPGARCLRCDYLLRGVSEPRCPECGQPFNPSDPDTIRLPGRKPPWWQRYGDTPSWWHLATICALTLWFLEAASRPFAGPFSGSSVTAAFCFVPLLLLFLIGNYVTCLIALPIRRKHAHQSSKTRPIRGKWKWLVSPLCLVIMLWAFKSDQPLRIRFALSRPSLETVARNVLAGSPVSGHRLIGLYWIDTVEKTYDGGVFFQTGTDLIDSCGFWYFGGSAADPLGTGTHNLAPRWHLREF